MYKLGIDIGTTTICAVVVDNKNCVMETVNTESNAFIESSDSFERIQDVTVIENKAIAIVNDLLAKYDVTHIGVTGQMHGILYTDINGKAVSPLYTWQDGRGDELCGDMSYAQKLACISGYRLATGYGTVTHFYNMENGLVPNDAVFFLTIHDYIAMKLAGNNFPVMHASDAASLGIFDIEKCEFDLAAAKRAGISPSFFPKVVRNISPLGKLKNATVFTAIGDNQASFLGSVSDSENSILINVGTGSQISVAVNGETALSAQSVSGIDVRPLNGDKFILVGASLCGGRAYQILEGFFRDVLKMAGCDDKRLYAAMDKLSEQYDTLTEKLDFSTLFAGTRENPALRGTVSGISTSNFTATHFVVGVLEGTVNELYDTYEKILPLLESVPTKLIASGNGIRKSHVTREMFASRFHMTLEMPLNKEEAAFGAAISTKN